jgi:hypothetical protein
MAWYADLSHCGYFDGVPGWDTSALRAVGWLSSAEQFAMGQVSEEIFAKLCGLLRNPWGLMDFMGHHACELCTTHSPRSFVYRGASILVGNGEVFVPWERCILVAPSLVLHYIDAHQYLPPTEFLSAVLRCPEMGSREYLQALREAGADPKWLPGQAAP